LPGEETILQTAEPSIKVNILPIKTDNSTLNLPKLPITHVILQPNMTIEAIKKYIATKLNMDLSWKEIDILFKNQAMKDHFTLQNINSLYHFNTDKPTLCYLKKSA
jgi:hypothetical protein